MKLPELGYAEDKDAHYNLGIVNLGKPKNEDEIMRVNRFFKTQEEKHKFFLELCKNIEDEGGHVYLNERTSHPMFHTYDVFNNQSKRSHQIVYYLYPRS